MKKANAIIRSTLCLVLMIGAFYSAALHAQTAQTKAQAREEKVRAKGKAMMDKVEQENKREQAAIAEKKRKAGMHYNAAWGEWQ
jgi:hypothetical protein